MASDEQTLRDWADKVGGDKQAMDDYLDTGNHGDHPSLYAWLIPGAGLCVHALSNSPRKWASFRDNVQRSAPIYLGSHSEKVAQLDSNPVWFDPKSMPSSGYSDSYRDIWAFSTYSF